MTLVQSPRVSLVHIPCQSASFLKQPLGRGPAHLFNRDVERRVSLLVVASSGRQRQGSQRKKKSKKQKKPQVGTLQSSTVLPDSRDAAVTQGSEALRVAIDAAIKGRARGLVKKEPSQVMGGDRIQVDIPVMSDSMEDMVQLARELLQSSTRKNNVMYVVPQRDGCGNGVVSLQDAVDVAGVDIVILISPKTRDVERLDAILNRHGSQDAVFVLLNPEWSASQGNVDVDGVPNKYIDLVKSFEAAYCFLPILVKPLMMPSMEGVVYRNLSSDGGHTHTHGEASKPWKVYLMQPGKTGFDLVGQMNTRPSSQDVESIFYNAIAASQKNPLAKNINNLKNLFGRKEQ
eukprot:jgi/Picre1/31919/NNA_007267.t1